MKFWILHHENYIVGIWTLVVCSCKRDIINVLVAQRVGQRIPGSAGFFVTRDQLKRLAENIWPASSNETKNLWLSQMDGDHTTNNSAPQQVHCIRWKMATEGWITAY